MFTPGYQYGTSLTANCLHWLIIDEIEFMPKSMSARLFDDHSHRIRSLAVGCDDQIDQAGAGEARG
jgi:hypothetical protein